MMVWILLPAYNEEASLPRLLPKIDDALRKEHLDYRVIVVDDGSTDNTAEALLYFQKEFPIEIVTHRINRGLGETERDGFEHISFQCDNDDIIIRIDCDDTHEPKYFISLINKIREGCDVVIASRFQPGGGQMGVKGNRAFVSYSANVFMKVLFNISGVKDYSCGYRAYLGGIIKDAVRIYGNSFIQLRGLGFTSTLETIVKLNLMGCKFGEASFVLRYDQKASASKMISSLTTLGYFTMAILYHWPIGGWKSCYRGLGKIYQRSPEEACKRFDRSNAKTRMLCRIGG
jgi:dolichol-phosphate mannosyltransferase